MQKSLTFGFKIKQFNFTMNLPLKVRITIKIEKPLEEHIQGL